MNNIKNKEGTLLQLSDIEKTKYNIRGNHANIIKIFY